MNKKFQFVFLMLCVVAILISAVLYWSKIQTRSILEKSQWIVENTKQLSGDAHKNGAEIVPDHFLHLYVGATLGQLDLEQMRNIKDNYCYEVVRKCAEVNLVMANVLLSKLKIVNERSIRDASNLLSFAEKYYATNTEHSPIAYETTKLLLEMFKIRIGGDIENKSQNIISNLKSSYYLTNLDFSNNTKFSEFHSEVCDLRLAIIAKLLAYAGETDTAVYLFVQLDEKLRKFK